jgi:hypothetical protein
MGLPDTQTRCPATLVLLADAAASCCFSISVCLVQCT